MKSNRLFITCLELCRISNLPTVWTNVLAAQVLATGSFTPRLFLLPACALSAFYMAGIALNDLCDYKIDRLARPGRPLPSGRISLQGARWLVISLFALGFFLLTWTASIKTLVAALLLLTAIVFYDLYHKKNPLSVFVMALCRFLVFAVTALAVTGSLAPKALLAGGLQFVYVLVISMIARHENRRPTPFSIPLIPLMLAGISLLDGLVLATLVTPAWLIAGMCGTLLTWFGQRYVRGD